MRQGKGFSATLSWTKLGEQFDLFRTRCIFSFHIIPESIYYGPMRGGPISPFGRLTVGKWFWIWRNYCSNVYRTNITYQFFFISINVLYIGTFKTWNQFCVTSESTPSSNVSAQLATFSNFGGCRSHAVVDWANTSFETRWYKNSEVKWNLYARRQPVKGTGENKSAMYTLMPFRWSCSWFGAKGYEKTLKRGSKEC